MDRNKTAKEVSLAQLHNWLKENSHLTWSLGGTYSPGAFTARANDKEGRPIIKYIYPNIDMRFGHIFFLRTEGMGAYSVDFREEFEGTILDLLLHKIKNGITFDKDPYYELDRAHEKVVV